MNVFDSIKFNLRQQNKLTILIVLNVALFLTINIGIHILHINLIPYLGLSINANEFLFKFWTLFTYMFSHENIMHILYNIILLYFTGQIFYSILGEKRLLYVYTLSGVCGGALFLILGLLMPQTFGGHYLIGASAAVMGVMMVTAVYAPDLIVNLFFLIEIKFKFFAIGVFLLSTVIDFSINTGGKISHLGGAVFGLMYGYYLKNGYDLFNTTMFNKSKRNLKIIHKSNQTISKSDESDEKKLNKLLDKIAKGGYDSLSKAEKQELFKLSQKK